ncbi:AraC family transcriptional regulator [Amaricoccus sp.]|uniref:helix-turn-helix domain-containing protein n=1 Tax=Amaricoccus sp. TaxID=1872485 RepID=UPI001B5DABD7|nr:AraC family transcriptional regulator [Amaricoccus sp.]MBP7003377.1 helix-turn-helix transcriptional regulator [Amaricoccus sp.]
MDETGGRILEGIPAHALGLRLARSTIKMRHAETWRVDKSNDVHDLVICLTGSARYRLDGVEVGMTPGSAMLIPAGAHFIGRHEAGETYTGIAQHFTLDIFGKVDLIASMRLDPVAPIPRWQLVEPLVRHYRDIAPEASTTLTQHHLFMVILLEYLEAAFRGWRGVTAALDPGDALSLHIMRAAAEIAADPLGAGTLDRALAAAPYNAEYFRRAFRDKIGWTPQKFLEFKKMERASNILSGGHSVKETAALVGYEDPYFFSRMFKRYMGASPATHQLRVREAGAWQPAE